MYIYKVTNTINHKIYIGQTSKDDPNYLGSGPIIMKAVKKYGKDKFIKEIIETCLSKSHLNEREIYWINYFDSTSRYIGYNISTGGNGGNLGDLVNEKLSNSAKGYIITKDINGNIFKVKSNDERYLNGELVGINKGIVAHNKGVPMSEEQKTKLKKPKSEEYKKNMSISRMGKNTKKILCLNNNIIYDSIKEAAMKLNLTVPNVVAVLKGRAKRTKGYTFIYV